MIIVVLPFIILIIILLLLSGFFSGSEIAFAKCNLQRLRSLSANGNKSASLAVKIHDNFSSTLSAILAGNELVNIAASSAATVLALNIAPYNQALAQTVASASLTVALLIFGEIVPKIIFSRQADKMVLFASGPINLLTLILKPLIVAVDWMVKKLSVLWERGSASGPAFTLDELSAMVDICEEAGQFSDKDSRLLRNTIRYFNSKLKVNSVMTSRVEATAFCIDDGIDFLTDPKNGLLNKYSYIPVYKDSLDNIIGILPTKEFKKSILSHGAGNILNDGRFPEILIRPTYIYEKRRIPEAYSLLKKSKSGMLIVLDEFGGMTGIVTKEDIYEQIVGEIYDERDGKQRNDIIKYSDNGERLTCIVRGGLSLNDFFEKIRDRYNYRLHDIASTQSTVGGWISEILGHAASDGDTTDEDGISIKILKAKDGRVLLAELRITPDS